MAMMCMRRWGRRARLGLPPSCFLTVVVGRAFESRRLPDLELWHRSLPAREVRAADVTPGFTLADYLAREEEVFAEVAREVSGRSDRTTPRCPTATCGQRVESHAPGLRRQPHLRTRAGADSWRRAARSRSHRCALQPARRRRPARLAGPLRAVTPNARPRHGAGGADLGDMGRLDGGRTRRDAPRASAGWAGTPIYLVGYSNGGALAVKYSLDALQMPGLPKADRARAAVADDRRLAVCAVRLDDERLRLGAVLRAVALARRPAGVSAVQVHVVSGQRRAPDLSPDHRALRPAARGRGVEQDARAAADPHFSVAGRHDRAHRRRRPRAVRPARSRRQRAGAVRRQPAVAHCAVLPRRLGRTPTGGASALPADPRDQRLTDTLDVVEQYTASGGRETAVRPLGWRGRRWCSRLRTSRCRFRRRIRSSASARRARAGRPAARRARAARRA